MVSSFHNNPIQGPFLGKEAGPGHRSCSGRECSVLRPRGGGEEGWLEPAVQTGLLQRVSCRRRHRRPLKSSHRGWGDTCSIASSCCRNRFGVRYRTPSRRSGSNGAREAARTATRNVSSPLPSNWNQSPFLRAHI